MSALIWAPFPDKETAQLVVRSLLEERLIACGNIIQDMQSLFLWDGEIQQSGEVGVLFKTDARLLQRAIDRLEELHPYEVPAIFGWPCSSVGKATQNWLASLL
ncbi:MAG: divalent-cation tolerance protein CutA [Sphingomonadaceae bacterium]